MLGVEDGQPLGGLEGEHVPLVQSGAVLLPDEVGPVGLEEGATLGGDVLSRAGGLRESGVHEVDVGLFDRELAIHGAGR